eukprot:UN07275
MCESIPQLALQLYILLEMKGARKATGVTETELYVSVTATTINIVYQFIRLRAQASKRDLSLVKYFYR